MIDDSLLTEEFEFKIDGADLRTVPMGTIGDYIRLLSKLAGEREHVHLTSVRPGSIAMSLSVVGRDAAEHVRDRFQTAKRPDGGSARAAWQDLNEAISQAGGHGMIVDTQDNTVILQFPGTPAVLSALPAFGQAGTIRGRLVGLRSDGFQVRGTILNAGGRQRFVCSEELARALRVKLLDDVENNGSPWGRRDGDASWTLVSFRASGFAPLRNGSLSELRRELQDAGGFGPGDPETISAELAAMR